VRTHPFLQRILDEGNRGVRINSNTIEISNGARDRSEFDGAWCHEKSTSKEEGHVKHLCEKLRHQLKTEDKFRRAHGC